MTFNLFMIIVVVIFAVALFSSLGLLGYLMKRLIDDKPIAFKETAAPGTPPQIITRADLKVAREYQAEQNFRAKDQNKYADLDSLSPEMAMNELDKFNQLGDK